MSCTSATDCVASQQPSRIHRRLQTAYQAVITADSVNSLQSLSAQSYCTVASEATEGRATLQEAYFATHIQSHLRLLLLR